MRTRNCLVRDHPRGETSSSCDLLSFLLCFWFQQICFESRTKSQAQVKLLLVTTSFDLLEPISSQPAVDKRANSCFLFPQFQVPGSLINITQVPQPPFFAPCKNPFNTNWLIDYTPISSYSMSSQTQKSPPYHISRLCKDPIDIAEWSHLKNLLKSCFHQFSVFFKGNLTFWLLRTSQNCSVRLLWTSQTPDILELTSLALLFPIISRSASVLSSW